MPAVTDVLDDNRYNEIRTEAIRVAVFWLSLSLAAERKDKADCNHACEKIRTLTKATFALVKALGTEAVP